MTKVETAVNEFVENVAAYWHGIDDGSSRAANGHLKKNDRLVQRLQSQGTLSSVLGGLLADERSSVRCAAAAYLVANGPLREQAISVLRKIAAEDPTLVAITADAVLRIQGIDAPP